MVRKRRRSKQVHEDRSMSALDRVKEITTLGSRDIKDTLTLFASKADDRGIISEEDFDATFEEMIKDPHPDLQDTLDVLYTAIDQNGDGELCIRELMIGLIVVWRRLAHQEYRSVQTFRYRQFQLHQQRRDGDVSSLCVQDPVRDRSLIEEEIGNGRCHTCTTEYR